MRISDWSSDVCSSDLVLAEHLARGDAEQQRVADLAGCAGDGDADGLFHSQLRDSGFGIGDSKPVQTRQEGRDTPNPDSLIPNPGWPSHPLGEKLLDQPPPRLPVRRPAGRAHAQAARL